MVERTKMIYLTSPMPCTRLKMDIYLYFIHIFIGSEVKITSLCLVCRVNKGYLVNLEFQVKEVNEEHKVTKDNMESLA